MKVDVELANDVTDLGFVTVLLVEAVDQIQLTDPVPSTTLPPAVDDAVDPEAETVDSEPVEEANP